MIDWHSHILPNVDDGSHDVAESIELLKQLNNQDVDTVVATPHFIANNESLESFLNRRDEAYKKLNSELTDDLPKVLLGAEVKYYPGISRLEGIKQLTISGSKLLLLEMPMSKWTEYTVRELIELAASKKVTVVLAHIERYLKLQNKAVWNRLYESGILMQVNASYFTGISRRKAINQLCDGKIHFIGTDCHNLNGRPPNMNKATEFICKKIGYNFINQMNEYGYAMLVNK